MKSILALIFFLGVLGPSTLWARSHGFHEISSRDREVLEQFFDCLLHESSLGYTLCGEKPVSLETIPSFSKLSFKPALLILCFHYRRYSRLWKGIETWNRYASVFSSEDFVLRFIPEFDTIVLVNRPAVKRVVEKNIDLFRKYDDPEISVDEVVEEVCYARNKEYLVGHHQALLGLLLGYGRQNALAFSDPDKRALMKVFSFPGGLVKERGFLNPGFLVLPDEMNFQENSDVYSQFCRSRKQLLEQFEDGPILEKWFNQFLSGSMPKGSSYTEVDSKFGF